MTLQDEIRQTRPFTSLEQEAHLRIVRTASILNDGIERVLKPAGLTGAQYNVLRILRGAGGSGLCRNEVRDRMLTRMPDMTRLLDRMEDAGLVERVRSTEDRRLVATHITPKARDLLASLEEEIEAEHQRTLGHLTQAELRDLIDRLDSISEGS